MQEGSSSQIALVLQKVLTPNPRTFYHLRASSKLLIYSTWKPSSSLCGGTLFGACYHQLRVASCDLNYNTSMRFVHVELLTEKLFGYRKVQIFCVVASHFSLLLLAISVHLLLATSFHLLLAISGHCCSPMFRVARHWWLLLTIATTASISAWSVVASCSFLLTIACLACCYCLVLYCVTFGSFSIRYFIQRL